MDVEDLFHMLRQKPFVNEKENAHDFTFNSGKIEFENLGFKHFVHNEKENNINSKLLF